MENSMVEQSVSSMEAKWADLKEKLMASLKADMLVNLMVVMTVEQMGFY